MIPGTGEALDTLHTLALLKDILAQFPLNSMKSCCETILRMMTLSNVVGLLSLELGIIVKVSSIGSRIYHHNFSSSLKDQVKKNTSKLVYLSLTLKI